MRGGDDEEFMNYCTQLRPYSSMPPWVCRALLYGFIKQQLYAITLCIIMYMYVLSYGYHLLVPPCTETNSVAPELSFAQEFFSGMLSEPWEPKNVVRAAVVAASSVFKNRF